MTLAIRYASTDFAGADRLLFGSDHPWVSIDAIMRHVRALECSRAEMAQILGGNARQLFRIS